MEAPVRMEVDPPPASTSTQNSSPADGRARTSEEDVQLNTLKRSNSAPMINALGLPTTETSTPTTSATDVHIICDLKPLERTRRFSTSSMALNTPMTPMKGPSRLIQIRNEESVTQKDREVRHEREIQSAMQLSQSMEEIFVDESMSHHNTAATLQPPAPTMPPSLPAPEKRPKSIGEPLHVHVAQYYPYASSPSPTRIMKQCFSPSLQQPVYRSGGLTPSPSPSPTRKTFASPLSRRSLSPITLRPSPLGNLGTKRKMDLDGEKMDTFCSPAKRFHASSPGGSTPERPGHVTYHQLFHSVSSSSFDTACNSPDQRVPANLSTTGAVSSSSSPGSFFRPVRESTDSRCTESDASDLTETTDMSEHTDLSVSRLSNLSESGVTPCDTVEVGVTPLSTSMSPPRRLSPASSSSPLTQTLSSMSVSTARLQASPGAAVSVSSVLSPPVNPAVVVSSSSSSPVSSTSSSSVQFFTQSTKVTQV